MTVRPLMRFLSILALMLIPALLIGCGDYQKYHAEQEARRAREKERKAQERAAREEAKAAEQKRTASAKMLKPGDIGKISKTMFVGVDGEAFDALMKAAGARDDVGIKEVFLADRGFVLQPGTKVRILDFGFGKYEIRVLDGPRKDRAGWIIQEVVTPEP